MASSLYTIVFLVPTVALCVLSFVLNIGILMCFSYCAVISLRPLAQPGFVCEWGGLILSFLVCLLFAIFFSGLDAMYHF